MYAYIFFMNGPTTSIIDLDDNITEIQSRNKYSINSFNCKLQNKNNLFIINFNIKSFNSTISEFSSYTDQHNLKPYTIIVPTKTWFGDGVGTGSA